MVVFMIDEFVNSGKIILIVILAIASIHECTDILVVN
jgi:hypothetical protein